MTLETDVSIRVSEVVNAHNMRIFVEDSTDENEATKLKITSDRISIKNIVEPEGNKYNKMFLEHQIPPYELIQKYVSMQDNSYMAYHGEVSGNIGRFLQIFVPSYDEIYRLWGSGGKTTFPNIIVRLYKNPITNSNGVVEDGEKVFGVIFPHREESENNRNEAKFSKIFTIITDEDLTNLHYLLHTNTLQKNPHTLSSTDYPRHAVTRNSSLNKYPIDNSLISSSKVVIHGYHLITDDLCLVYLGSLWKEYRNL